jgi:hypothetical protein
MASDRLKPVVFGLRVVLVAAAVLALIAGYPVNTGALPELLVLR